MGYQKPKGTLDILPSESGVWLYVEDTIRRQAELAGFKLIRFPTFEATELFNRGVGGTTDIVQKEMYTFIDKDGSSLTLRPEGTACVARSVLENGLYAGAMPLKLYYLSNFFRRERPQAGRSREFWQFGVELFGSAGAEADASVILLANNVFRAFGLQNIKLKINSIGCPNCRPAYREALKKHFERNQDELCQTCKDRLDTNPLRILDCKSPVCKNIAKGAPRTIDFLCDDCKAHFDKLKTLLDDCGVSYEIDTNIVRGLDYYTKTVFEFINESIGAQSTVCGGGRYDGLIETLGGQPTPGLGFASGLERLLMVMDAQGIEIPKPEGCRIFLAALGEAAEVPVQKLVYELRKLGVKAERDTTGRGLKAQMKYADRLGAAYSMVIGDNELNAGIARIKDMSGGGVFDCPLNAEDIKKAVM